MRLRVTDTQLDYEGSITIGRKLLNGLLDGEKVQVTNMNTGKQFETYVIAGSGKLREKVSQEIRTLLFACGVMKYVEGISSTFTDRILDLCEEGVCVNGAAARLVQIGDEIEVTNGEGG